MPSSAPTPPAATPDPKMIRARTSVTAGTSRSICALTGFQKPRQRVGNERLAGLIEMRLVGEIHVLAGVDPRLEHRRGVEERNARLRAEVVQQSVLREAVASHQLDVDRPP